MKSPTRYARAYFDLFESASRGPVVIPCRSYADAQRRRARLYAFREAVYNEPGAFPRMTLLAPLLEFNISSDDRGPYITIQAKEPA